MYGLQALYFRSQIVSKLKLARYNSGYLRIIKSGSFLDFPYPKNNQKHCTLLVLSNILSCKNHSTV